MLTKTKKPAKTTSPISPIEDDPDLWDSDDDYPHDFDDQNWIAHEFEAAIDYD